MTTQDLIDEITTKYSAILPASGQLTDAEIDLALNGTIDVYNNIDPDRPVKVRNIGRL